MALEFRIFKEHPELIFGLSEKENGEMALAGDWPKDKNRIKNSEAFFAHHGIPPTRVFQAGLSHSANVGVATSDNKGKIINDTDALITADRNTFLSLTVADCFPTFFYDPVQQAAGLVHAGWRGVCNNIIIAALAKMRNVFSSDPRLIKAGIGPGIGPCHFEIKEDILTAFKDYPEQIIREQGRIFVDLPQIIKRQLLEFGLKSGNIELSGQCTYCLKQKYFSFRRDKPDKLQAMLAFIGIK